MVRVLLRPGPSRPSRSPISVSLGAGAAPVRARAARGRRRGHVEIGERPSRRGGGGGRLLERRRARDGFVDAHRHERERSSSPRRGGGSGRRTGAGAGPPAARRGPRRRGEVLLEQRVDARRARERRRLDDARAPKQARHRPRRARGERVRAGAPRGRRSVRRTRAARLPIRGRGRRGRGRRGRRGVGLILEPGEALGAERAEFPRGGVREPRDGGHRAARGEALLEIAPPPNRRGVLLLLLLRLLRVRLLLLPERLAPFLLLLLLLLLAPPPAPLRLPRLLSPRAPPRVPRSRRRRRAFARRHRAVRGEERERLRVRRLVREEFQPAKRAANRGLRAALGLVRQPSREAPLRRRLPSNRLLAVLRGRLGLGLEQTRERGREVARSIRRAERLLCLCRVARVRVEEREVQKRRRRQPPSLPLPRRLLRRRAERRLDDPRARARRAVRGGRVARRQPQARREHRRDEALSRQRAPLRRVRGDGDELRGGAQPRGDGKAVAGAGEGILRLVSHRQPSRRVQPTRVPVAKTKGTTTTRGPAAAAAAAVQRVERLEPFGGPFGFSFVGARARAATRRARRRRRAGGTPRGPRGMVPRVVRAHRRAAAAASRRVFVRDDARSLRPLGARRGRLRGVRPSEGRRARPGGAIAVARLGVARGPEDPPPSGSARGRLRWFFGVFVLLRHVVGVDLGEGDAAALGRRRREGIRWGDASVGVGGGAGRALRGGGGARGSASGRVSRGAERGSGRFRAEEAPDGPPG